MYIFIYDIVQYVNVVFILLLLLVVVAVFILLILAARHIYNIIVHKSGFTPPQI